MKQSTRNVYLQVITGTMIMTLIIWQGMRHRIVELDSGFYQTMGTFARVLVVASDKAAAEQSVEAALAVFDRIESLMSDYDPDSQISAVNRRAYEEPVAVDPEVFDVLVASVEYSRISDGAFDITVGPLVQLWRQARLTAVAPTPDQIADARSKVGWQNLRLDPLNKTVQFAVEGMALDLGGIAKGYAIDKAADAMRQAGAIGGMIDVGGDLLCFGRPVGGAAHWLIGLQDPAADEHILLRFKFDDRAAATSGDYRRFTLLDGHKYSHIVNPATADTSGDLTSVTVIAATAMQADALATAVSVLGPQKGMAMIETLDAVQALLIPAADPQNYIATPGLKAYLLNSSTD